MLGVVYSGNYYVVIDTYSPVDRLAKIYDVLKPVLSIGKESNLELAKELNVTEKTKLVCDLYNEEIDETLLSKVRARMISTDPIYVLFTSGSTGIPVIIETDCFYTKNVAMGGSFQYDVAPIIAPFKYHARWKELEAKDLYQKPGNKRPKKCFKGFLYETKNSHYKPDPNFMKTDLDGVKKIQKSVKTDIKEIVSMCNKRGVKVVLLTLPSANTWTMPKHNAVEKIAKDNNLLYLDLNVKSEDFNFDFANSFRDWGNHMNYYGAKQSTDYIIKFLNNNFELKNHKEDKKYESWNDLLLTFQDYKNKHHGVYE